MNIPTRPPNSFVPASGVGPHFGVGGGSGVFPHSWDGGIPGNAATPNNPAQAWIHDPFPPLDTSALYYSNGCDVRLRPHVLNSLISEIASTVERGEVGYRASRLTNLELATRYLIQRGLPRGQLFVEQNPWHFDVTLDPPATRYNDFMTLTLVPQMEAAATQNRGYVRMNVNGLGYAPLLRNDGYELRAGDLLPGKPFACAYFSGAWYYLGLVASQVPLVMTGAINFWIRPDGNDTTGDGTANSPDKAFRTINGCWYAVGSRYAGSPSAHIAMRLGIPGNYEAGNVGPFGATVSITGDVNNRAAYRIMDNGATNPGQTYSLAPTGCNSFQLRGVNCVNQFAGSKPGGQNIIWIGTSNVILDRVQITCEASNPNAACLSASYSSTVGAANADNPWQATDVMIVGNGTVMKGGIELATGSAHVGTGGLPPATVWHWQNINFASAGYICLDRSSFGFANSTTANFNTTGPRYLADMGSFVRQSAGAPGDQPGTVGNFSAAF